MESGEYWKCSTIQDNGTSSGDCQYDAVASHPTLRF
jgi:hypothetical protein